MPLFLSCFVKRSNKEIVGSGPMPWKSNRLQQVTTPSARLCLVAKWCLCTDMGTHSANTWNAHQQLTKISFKIGLACWPYIAYIYMDFIENNFSSTVIALPGTQHNWQLWFKWLHSTQQSKFITHNTFCFQRSDAKLWIFHYLQEFVALHGFSTWYIPYPKPKPFQWKIFWATHTMGIEQSN